MLAMITRLDQRTGNGVVDVKDFPARRHLEQRLMGRLGAAAHAVNIDAPLQRFWKRTEPKDIRAKRNMMAGLSNRALNRRHTSTKAQRHMIEIPEQLQVKIVF